MHSVPEESAPYPSVALISMWGRIRAHHGREGVLERAGTIPPWTLFRMGVETIAYIQTTVWIIELGELPDNGAVYEVIAAIREACSKAGSECTIQVVRD